MRNNVPAVLNSAVTGGISPRAERIVCALALVLSASPAFAVSPCPDNYRPYSFQGTVAESGTTADGRPWYVIANIPNPACGDEHQRIRAYPLAPVASCAVGKRAQASGIYTKSCVNLSKGSTCLAQVGLRDSKGGIDTAKGATVSCK
jgi:hypothetical protein